MRAERILRGNYLAIRRLYIAKWKKKPINYFDPEEYRAEIEGYSARQLKNSERVFFLKQISKIERGFDNYDYETDQPLYDLDNLLECYQILKEEMATREHVPSKLEGKVKRQAAAQKAKREKRGRARRR